MIKGKFPQEPGQWTLMDWKGLFAKTYAFEPKASNILVFGPGGSLLVQTHGREVEDDKVAEIATRIRNVLDLVGHAAPDARD